MEGVWRHERKGKGIALAIEPFPAAAWAREQAEEEAERLAKFLDARLERLSWR